MQIFIKNIGALCIYINLPNNIYNDCYKLIISTYLLLIITKFNNILESLINENSNLNFFEYVFIAPMTQRFLLSLLMKFDS